jgi:hypothetical protein
LSSEEVVRVDLSADGRRDSSFISTNLSNRPRGATDDPGYGVRSDGESLLDFLKYLEKEAEKDTYVCVYICHCILYSLTRVHLIQVAPSENGVLTCENTCIHAPESCMAALQRTTLAQCKLSWCLFSICMHKHSFNPRAGLSCVYMHVCIQTHHAI